MVELPEGLHAPINLATLKKASSMIKNHEY